MEQDNSSKLHPVFAGVEMGLGTWAWGDKLYWGYGRGYADAELKEALRISLEAGIRLIDTAEVYGQGKSEQLLGGFMKDIEPGSMRLATKFMPFPWRLGRGALLRALRGSLKRLGVSKVDLYQIHFPFPPIPVETWMEAMAEAHSAGLIDAIGVSNFDRSQMQRAQQTLLLQRLNLASNQVEFHLLNRKVEKNGLLQLCRESGVALIAYSPLAMGILTGKYTPEKLPQGFRSNRYGRKYLQQVQPLLVLLRKIAAENNKTPAQVALNWCICKGTIPIPGAKNLAQAEQNAGALGWRLSEKDVTTLDDVSDRVTGGL